MGSGDRFGLLEDPSIPKLGRLPEGWKLMDGTFTQPSGWLWAHNGMSIRSGKRKRALVREAR